jgi:hypothetical protein
MKSGVEILAAHPGWKTKSRKSRSAAKQRARIAEMENVLQLVAMGNTEFDQLQEMACEALSKTPSVAKPMVQTLVNTALVRLTAEDWTEIYYALEDKLKLSVAVKGEDREARQWRAHLRRIIKAIGPDGELAAASEYFDESELATVLAALRLFQETYDGKDADTIRGDWQEHFTASNGELIEPLGTEDIETLCQRINCGE